MTTHERPHWPTKKITAHDGRTITIERVSDVPTPKVRRCRVFVWPARETILDNLVNRRQRPVALWRAFAIDALRAEGIDPQGLRWNQRAGCGCGCSPGFVTTEYRDFDLHVTIPKGVPTTEA